MPTHARATLQPASSPDSPGEVCFGLDTPLPNPWAIGGGNILRLQGWCYHTRQVIDQLSILVDGVEHPVAEHTAPREDVFARAMAQGRPNPNSLVSGFYADIPFARIDAPHTASLQLRVTTRDGLSQVVPLGALPCLPSLEIERASAPRRAANEPLVAICMITYNPRPDWLIRQLDSIRGQTFTNWFCIINDDDSDPAIYRQIEAAVAGDTRFQLFRNPVNLGFYLNTERCLSRVPPEADFITLSDQDDIWFEDKLAALLAAFGPETNLAYSDMRIVSEQEQPLFPTYWTRRKNNYTSLDVLLFANTVTGAASMFRAALLRDVLPFPLPIRNSYHDHWIAAAALATGRIAYVDRPLYAYRQHGSNIIGHNTPRRHRFAFVVWRLIRWSAAAMFRQIDDRSRLWSEAAIYFNNLLITSYLARTLIARLAHPPQSAWRLAALGASVPRLFMESVRLTPLSGASLGYPWICLRGLLLHRLLKRVAFRDRQRITRRALARQRG